MRRLRKLLTSQIYFKKSVISFLFQDRTSTNWSDALAASGQLWVTQLLNVLFVSGVNVYSLRSC